jgi:hypothetical protein
MHGMMGIVIVEIELMVLSYIDRAAPAQTCPNHSKYCMDILHHTYQCFVGHG